MRRLISAAICVCFASAILCTSSALAQNGPKPIEQAAPAAVEATEVEGEATACDCCDPCGSGCRGKCAMCRMFPHYAYYPAMHGYYYFRPYHHSHLATQQAFVMRFGGDPRHPYANEVFGQVYAAYRAEGGAGASPAPAKPK